MIHEISDIFAKTKILGTLGPATSSKEQIMALMAAGIDGVRLNFSHGDYTFYEELFATIEKACTEEDAPLAVLLDLQGPKIRVGELAEPEYCIKTGDRIEITTEKMKGTAEKISTSYKELPNDAKIGEIILIDDGLLRLRIVEKTQNSVICEIENGGVLKPKKGMNLPGMKLSTPSMTEKDLQDLEFALKHRIDYVALSFVRQPGDIIALRQWMTDRGYSKPIIAKIEKKEAVDCFAEILKVTDGVMVARGDLGVEMNPEDVPIIQKSIIRQCNAVGKLVITATQMLESMINNPIPTRAEASDVANAVWDGTDVVMLSGETSVGKYPVRTVEVMNNILLKAESNLQIKRQIEFVIPDSIEENLFDATNHAICSVADQTNAVAIIVLTHEGRAAKRLSKFRPRARIIAVSDGLDTIHSLCLKWGITSLYFPEVKKDSIVIEQIKQMVLESGHVKKGDLVLITAGAPYSEKSRLNWMKFEEM
jgi:pyruvate kinase